MEQTNQQMQTTLMLPTGDERVEDPPFHITLDTYAHFFNVLYTNSKTRTTLATQEGNYI